VVRAQLEQLLASPPPSDKPRTFKGAKAVPLDFLGWRFFDVLHQLKPVDSHKHKKRTLAQIKKGITTAQRVSGRCGSLSTPFSRSRLDALT